MDKVKLAATSPAQHKENLIVIGEGGDLLRDRWRAISTNVDSLGSAPSTRSPCSNGISACPVSRAYAWI